MTSTVFGYFDSRERAEAAADRLRRDFPDKNFSITVRQKSEENQSTDMNNMGFTSTTNINITKQAMNLGATMGKVTGQMMGMVAGSVVNAPFMMMNMMMTPMTNPNPGTMMSNMMNTMMDNMNTMNNVTTNNQNQGDANHYTVKFETNDPLEEINQVLQQEGAQQIKVYTENT